MSLSVVAVEEGVIVCRVHGELISIKTDRGLTRSFKVSHEVGAQLDLGKRAIVSLDERGRPIGVTVSDS